LGADLINLPWITEAWRFVATAWVAVRGLIRGLWRYIMSGGKAWGGRPRVEVVGRDTLPEQTEVVEEEEEEEDQDEAVYNRFLRQEEISDDDDDPAREWDLGESSGSEDEDEQERELVDAETVGLYTDLGPTTSAPVLLAHMTHDADFPLTRRRYGSLLNSGPLVPETPVIRTLFQSILHPRRTYYFLHSIASSSCTGGANRRGAKELCHMHLRSQRNHLLAVSVRSLRPSCFSFASSFACSCLSMCDGCREILASRSSASKHRCPCCRQPVEGYSRVFIP
jgi:hypothetical protein